MPLVKERDRKTVEILRRRRQIKSSATALGITRKAVYDRIASIKKRYKESRGFVNWVVANCRNDEWMAKKLLPQKPDFPEPEDLEKDN
jgi:hypothetical protein